MKRWVMVVLMAIAAPMLGAVSQGLVSPWLAMALNTVGLALIVGAGLLAIVALMEDIRK